MVEELIQEALTREQIFEYLIKKPNIIKKKFMLLDTLEMNVGNEENSLRPYVHIIDTENCGRAINPKLPNPRLEIRLAYSSNPINTRLINKIFHGNENIKINYGGRAVAVFGKALLGEKSTYASREIRELGDVDDILDLATRYHEIVNSEDYDKISKSYRKGIDNLANELVDGLVKI